MGVANALPFVGFGFLDNFTMIIAVSSQKFSFFVIVVVSLNQLLGWVFRLSIFNLEAKINDLFLVLTGLNQMIYEFKVILN